MKKTRMATISGTVAATVMAAANVSERSEETGFVLSLKETTRELPEKIGLESGSVSLVIVS